MDIFRSPETNTFFSYDEAAAKDEFERRSFSDRLTRLIIDERGGNPLVVSIVNPWGGGKSTILRYIQDAVAATTRDESPHIKNCRITTFNPWRYAGEDQLLFHLFERLVTSINEKSPLSASQAILKLLPKWIKRTALICNWLAPGTGSLLEGFFSTISPEQFEIHLDAVRQTTREYLAKTGVRVIMLLDDVDRLDPDDIMLLFRALKLIVDLPNTTFIIAMDDEHVSDVIGKRIGGGIEGGRRYIEKIVNVRLSVPKIPDDVLDDYVMQRFKAVWRRELKERAKALGTAQKSKPTEPDPQDEERTKSIFRALHLHHIKTPRTVKSIENAFAFALGLLPDEVNAGDVLLLEATRLLHPQLYLALPEVIPNLEKNISRPFIETMMNEDADNQKTREQKAKIVRDLVNLIQTSPFLPQKPIEEALIRWFPQLGDFYSRDEEEENERAKRICSPNYYFWRYYSGAVHKTRDVADADVEDWLDLAINSEKKSQAVEALKNHLGKPYFRVFFKKLGDFLIARQDSVLPLNIIAEVASTFPEEEGVDSAWSLWHQATAMINTVIKKTNDKKKQIAIATEIVKATKNLRWNFVFFDHVATADYLNFRAKEGEEQRQPSPFDEELAQQSIEAYESGFSPQSNNLICKMVWSICRNLQIPDLAARVHKLAKENPDVALQFLVAGCTFVSSESHKAACWQWNGDKGLSEVEKIIPMLALKLILKDLPKKPHGLELPSDDFECLTLQGVGWACLDSIREREDKMKEPNATEAQ
ncbi:P-loop NTPase fold protein [Prosthecobacter sp.]|uniref:KAP family P-loop NTPase fold protein n=1 Tax=Prosthecobacter sp. TaxID=1965333 RepID=UPI0024873B8E|nr:P-loop NTPase fold protein [Prosthecobacter sp.]MDI1313121.1 P-loop NTPase fold protein [Prosthecobacter sp.]